MKSILSTCLFLINTILSAQYGWTPQHPNQILNDLSSVKFIDAKRGYAVGSVGCIIKTATGEYTWSQIQKPISKEVNYDKIVFTSANNGWIVGIGELILKTTNSSVAGSIERNLGSLPIYFTLSQNYPNPFNPTTKIRYEIPTAGNVKLSLFDILGREASRILNEFKEAGTYEVEFNANGLSSGIYFYKLICNNHTPIKKMVLSK